LVTGEGNKWKILTDIQGIEDALGDMDFKVAGTRDGITGLQMDIKTIGLSYDIMRAAFAQAREARLQILEKMESVLPAPRKELSPYAPRITILQISVDKIGAVIGPGGKTIRSIIEQTGATINVESDGRIFIATADAKSASHAVEIIEGLTREAKVGDIFLGKVVRIMPSGAFINILPGKDGMVHISELSDTRVENIDDEIAIGDEINVMVINVDEPTGKVSLSRRAILTGESPEQRNAARMGSGGSRSNYRGDRNSERSDSRSSTRNSDRERDRPGERTPDRNRPRQRRRD
jgi:polyribonucleotide nucleotidyltransferase